MQLKLYVNFMATCLLNGERHNPNILFSAEGARQIKTTPNGNLNIAVVVFSTSINIKVGFKIQTNAEISTKDVFIFIFFSK